MLLGAGMLLMAQVRKEFLADVGIKDGKIIKIGNLNSVDAEVFIDAKGLKVVPGFIDIHSHTDSDLILKSKS